MTESIGEIVRKMENDYTTGVTKISKYVDFDMHETLNKIDAYLNSTHTTGETDAIGREKPFFNIVKAAVNIWYRTTNIAQNKIRIFTTKKAKKALAFVATVKIQDWARRANFETFLDKWGITLARYGSAVVKFVKKDGKLSMDVVPWNRIICDPIKFDGNPQIEVLEFSEAELKKQGYNPEMVEDLIESAGAAREILNKEKKDNKDNYFKVYEVHYEFSQAVWKNYKGMKVMKEDENIFFPQMYAISFVGIKNQKGENDYQDFILAGGKEESSPNMITHLLEEDGRTLGVGAVEDLFNAQWMANHSAKQIKDTLDFASLIITQTSDNSFVGKNVLTGLMTGDILIHSEGNPLTQINTQHDITQIQSFRNDWLNLAKEITSTPDAVRGNTQPSGTAFRTVAAESNEGKSLFEVFRRTKKKYLARMLREFIIPKAIIPEMDSTEEITAALESQDITVLDQMYSPNKAIQIDNKQIIDTVLDGEIAYNLNRDLLEQDIRKQLSQDGNQRFLKPSDIPTKTWKEALKDFEWEIDIDERDRQQDDDLVAQYMIDIFKTASNPAVQQFITTPQGKFLFNRMLESTKAISPIEIPQQGQEQMPQIQQPSGGSPAVQINPRSINNNGNPQPMAA